MKGRMKVYKCLECGYELTSDMGIWHHIKKEHNTKPPIKKTVHYDLVDAADKQQIITPEKKFIDEIYHMTLFKFKCRAIEISHSCAHNKEQEPQHPSQLLDCIKDIESSLKTIPFNGTIKSPTNNYQINFDFDNRWIKSMEALGWDSEPLDKLRNFKDIPNIKPDGILTKDEISISLEIEKSNKKTIWFDYMKLMLIIGKGIVDFGLLVTPKNYAHTKGIWNLFHEARYYRYCLSQYAKVDEELLSKIAIIGYTQEVYVSDKWNTLDSSVIKSFKERAKKIFEKRSD